MVQDLKGLYTTIILTTYLIGEPWDTHNLPIFYSGNIRVYCRVRPSFSCSSKDVIEFIGEDGSLMILDPLKPKKDGRRVFRFNRVFGPAAKQGISLMVVYNVTAVH